MKKKLVLVDLDSLVCCAEGKFGIDVITSLWTPSTKFVFFGLDQVQSKGHIQHITRTFQITPKSARMATIQKTIPDGAELLMFDWIGRNLDYVKSFDQAVIFSNDHFVFGACAIVRRIVKEFWLARPVSDASGTAHQNRSAKQLGFRIPELRIKRKKS